MKELTVSEAYVKGYADGLTGDCYTHWVHFRYGGKHPVWIAYLDGFMSGKNDR